MATESRPLPRWPLILIAAPAAVAIWSGWVGLGELCGFGPVHVLPGISDGVVINTAIVLPIGVEAFGAYALGVWLRAAPVPSQAREFARWSAIGALALGMLGQIAFHLLSALHAVRAPLPVVVAVSCMPVGVLGLAAALAHLMSQPAEDEKQPARSIVARNAAEAATLAYAASVTGGNPLTKRQLHLKFGVPRTVADQIVQSPPAGATPDSRPAPAGAVLNGHTAHDG